MIISRLAGYLAGGELPASGSRAAVAAAAAALVLMAFVAWHPALQTQMVSDDFSLVGRIGFAEALSYFHESFGFGRNEYRPLTALSFAIDNWLWSERTAGYHFTNLILHAATAALLFLTLQALTADLALAFTAGLVFSIHPANHSRATWISARDATVCAVFLMAAAWLYVRARRRGAGGDWRAVVLACCSLLAYEAAVILPLVLVTLELLFFAKGTLFARLRTALRRTAPFWVCLAAYLALWHAVFSSGVAGYDLLSGPAVLADNYGRLLYTLFYGHRRVLFGLAYIVLFALCARLLLRQWRLATFACLLLAIGFVPFVAINGFAHRFAYFSGMGFATLLGLCFVTAVRNAGSRTRAAVASAAILLCGYYAIEVRKILREWRAAGELAARIPEKVRKLHPRPEEGSVLVFTNIPRMYGRAFVYPTGLEAAVQRQYPVKVHVRLQGPDSPPPSAASPGRHVYRYVGGEDVLIELKLD